MNLFIDSLSSPARLILFETHHTIIAQKNIDIYRNESSKLIGEITSFLSENDKNIENLKNIVTTHGPWSFTGVRSVILTVNTLAFRTDIFLTPINYFQLYDSYPIVKCSSKRDVFIKKCPESNIEIISNQDCISYIQNHNIKKIYWDFEIWENVGILCVKEIDYAAIIKNLQLQKEKQIEALYIKKPNIN